MNTFLVLSKVKVMLSLCLINYVLCPEDIWGSGSIAPSFLTSALHGMSGQLHALSTHLIGGWVDPTAGLDTVE
jgi:hypothetical protein